MLCLLLCGYTSMGQSTLSGGNPAQLTTIHNAPQRDTNLNKSNTDKWKGADARLTYEKLHTSRIYTTDTATHTFHRLPFLQPWKRDLGNLGSPALNLQFTPEYRVGPTLGYHAFDAYRFNVDSLGYYNTTRPYSVFSYRLGSRLEQVASLFHTQNIRPNWNFAVDYRKTNSPGFYRIQRVNHDNASFTTNYKSIDKHYILYLGMVYNKQQHDENGGVRNAADLDTSIYSDRRTVPTMFDSRYSLTRSAISNRQRDYTAMLQHSYVWGRTDTTYNADSTQYSYRLLPRFSITHRAEVSTEKHTYKDLTPDSLRYAGFFAYPFLNQGTGYYAAGGDSVFSEQQWFRVDNRLMLNGFLGSEGRQLKFSAGAGSRYDQFITTPTPNINPDSLPKIIYQQGYDRSSYLSNYIVAELKKEALNPGQWQYVANTQFYLTGRFAGNLSLHASLGKSVKFLEGYFEAGFTQRIHDAPYSYNIYGNQYTKYLYHFAKENVNLLYATIESPALKLSAGARNYLIGNYIYIDEQQKPAQYGIAFNVAQLWLRKMFRVGDFYLDNEAIYQQLPGSAPVNVPTLMGRHQLSYENDLFRHAIRMVAGVEVRYNTAYKPAAYSALLNRFYYQGTTSISNTPEVAVFLNFRIKRFRAFIMGDQLQKMFVPRNTVLFTGTRVTDYDGITYTPVYATPDATIRFGFAWALVN